jgi:putative membrane protein
MIDSLPQYALFLASSLGLLAVAMGIYMLITPFKEIELIRNGNSAAAISFSGTAIGMGLVLHSTASGTFDIMEMIIWGGIGLVGQLVALVVVMLLIPGLHDGITKDKTGYGILLGGLSVAMGVLNAGAISN